MPSHLTFDERDRIAQLRFQGFDQQEIAQAIGRCPTTVSRELRRNCTRGVYHAAAAQRVAERRRAERPLVRKMDRAAINERVRAGLAQEWSPEQIAGRAKQQPQPSDQPAQVVSPQTIYTWIKRDANRQHWEELLRRRGKRPYRRKPAVPNAAARIKNRPEVIEQRLRFGDFEGDTVMLEIRSSVRRARAAWQRSSIVSRGSRSSSRFNRRTPTTCMRKSNSG